MARKSRKNMPVAVAEPTDNLTAKAVLSMDKEAKPYQVGIYARLSFESEANKERDTVDTQIAYIREFINSQDDMVEVEVYADISVTGTTFERPEFDRMIQDIRAGRINTVITRDLSRLGRNYVEAGNYIERVFPFLDVRYIAITDDFDTARPGTDLSVPLKNIVNEYYSKDLSKKVETGKHSIWAQGGFSEGTPPYGYYRATDGSRKLLIDEEVSDNVVRIFNMFLDGEGYGSIAKTMQSEGILSPPKYRFYKAGKTEFAEKAREWHYSHVKEILQGEYYIGNIVHGKQRKALDTGRKNKKTDKSKWQRVENAHEPIIDKDTFYRVQERIELIRSKHLEGSKPNPEAPKKPDNILVYKTKCACCGGSVLIIRHHTYGIEYWYARELMKLLDYVQWRNFDNAINKAMISCENNGNVAEDHFSRINNTIEVGNGALREVEDYMLTRYACYLIAENGDPRKEQIAFAQSYFAVQTRKQELIEERISYIERTAARGKLRESEKRLSQNIYERGVDDAGFGRIRSKGDQALFGGFTTKQMKERLGVQDKRPLADFLPTLTIAAKNLATEMTNYNVEEKDLQGESAITVEHVENNTSVRDMLGQRGIKPEDLPASEDIKKLERRVKREEKKLAEQSGKLTNE